MFLAMAAVAVISAAAGYSLWQLQQQNGLQNVSQSAAPMPGQAGQSLIVLPEPRVIADFALVDQEGARFSLEDLQNQWSLLFFGFTHCPDVCPTTLYDLQKVVETLQPDSAELEPFQVVFVSVDPERDSPEQLKGYTEYFHPDFIGVTGDHQQLQPLTMQAGIAYRVEDHEAGDNSYQVDHSASILLFNPDGRLHGVFPAPHEVGAISADLAQLLN